ncbi:putative secondary metabolism biosynthetic enzyme [Diatrype stigma]|uniref:Secondary metabolism biosynthetic enzyme n=1 Tax=Diatrype stigma TaxID=117547 RepID=A0AAN9VA03_9PEZI
MACSITVGDETFGSVPWVAMQGVKFTSLGGAQVVRRDSHENSADRMCSEPTWEADLDMLEPEKLGPALGDSSISPGEMVRFCSVSNEVVGILCRRVLQSITPETHTPLPVNLQLYLNWMQKRCESLAANPKSDTDEDAVIKSFVDEFPFDGKFCKTISNNLVDVFAERVTPTAVLTAEDNLSRFYQETYGFPSFSKTFQNWFHIKSHKNPKLRVLQIGAGTASVTVPVLEQLGGRKGETARFSKWTSTDVSVDLLENAKTLLSDWEPRIEYQTLDIENDPIEQGFSEETYDVVLAVNALHATKDVRKTLENCRRLLKPGGNLVLGEITNPNDISSLIFGMLPEWWVSEDGRKDGPLMSQSKWDEALVSAGLSAAEAKLPDVGSETGAHRMSVMVSTRTVDQSPPAKHIIIVIPDGFSSATASVAHLISLEFENLGSRIEIKNLQSAATDIDGKTVVSILDFEESFLENLQRAQFEQLQHILLHAGEVLWVTRSDPADGLGGHPSKHIISGLLRCVKTEDASRRLYELHFVRELRTGLDATARAVRRRLCTIWSEKDRPEEFETVERDGVLCIPRYIPQDPLNKAMAYNELDAAPEVADVMQPDRPLKLTIGRPGMLDTLHFLDDEAPLQPLDDEEVEIEVKACGMNFL